MPARVTQFAQSDPGRVLLGILGRCVLPGSPNPDSLFLLKKMSFSTPVFKPDLFNPYPFSDLEFRQKLCHHYLDSSANKQILQMHFELLSITFLLMRN